MRRAGFDLARAPEARRDPREIAAYVELHIEQGPVLEAADVPIGVVEGIVGIRRFRLTFVGQPDHAGTTPMDRRKDAFLTAAEYATKSRELVVRGGQGHAVTTIGVVDVRPGVPNIVPERAVLLRNSATPTRPPRAPGSPLLRRPAGGATARLVLEVRSTSCGPSPSDVPAGQAIEATAAGSGRRRMPSAPADTQVWRR
jgi:N-carbamoyl-L-amino-acid hydrolase